MRNIFKVLLALVLLLSAIGASAQTTATNQLPGSAQENGTARLNESAQLFMSHLHNDGLFDRTFAKEIIPHIVSTHVTSTIVTGCMSNPNSCKNGLVCCVCAPLRCVSVDLCEALCQQ